MASSALDLGMSPKQFWQEYGARILGEPDVKRDAKGNLTEVQGKAPGQWKTDAFKQSWGDYERFKQFIVEASRSFKGSYAVLRNFLKSLVGRPLKVGNSGTLTLGVNGITELVNRPDGTRQVDDEIFKLAVANIEELLSRSIHGWSAPDKKGRESIDHVEKHFSGFIHLGKAYGVKITVRVVKENQGGKKLYELDAVEISSLEKGMEWLNKAYNGEPKSKASLPAKATREGRREEPERDSRNFNLTPMNPEVQGLIEALYHLGHGSFSQASRGDFYPDLKLIARWKSADRSTLLHETGHVFLEARMQAYADLLKRGGPQTPGEKHFAENMQAVMKFVGVKSVEQWQALSVDQKRKGHEKFARSFEAWLMGGKAPSENLEGVFAQFASWLKKLYVCLSGIPGAQFDSSVQDMFSNMLLAEAQIREASIRHNQQVLFTSAEEAGMTEEEFASYRQDVQDAINEAEAEQTERNNRLSERINSLRRSALRALQGAVKGELKRLRDEEQQAFEATQTYKAWDKIHNGVDVNGQKVSFKLPYPSLIKLGYGKAELEKLHKAGLAVKQPRKGSLPIDDLAVNLGYTDAKALVDDMLQNLKPKDVINQRAADRFVRENPDLATPEKVQDAAASSMFNKAKMKVLAAELKAFLRMARKQGKEADVSQVVQIAQQTVAGMKYSDINPQKYIVEANRAKREAREAWTKGDMDTAIKAKRRELAYSAMAKAAKEALTERAKSKHAFDKFKQKVKKSVDQRHWELIQRALANMGIFTEKQLSLNPEAQSFVAEVNDLMNATGGSLAAFSAVIDAIALRDMSLLGTPEGFRQFKDFIIAVEKLSRDEKHFTLADKKVELDDLE